MQDFAAQLQGLIHPASLLLKVFKESNGGVSRLVVLVQLEIHLEWEKEMVELVALSLAPSHIKKGEDAFQSL